MQRTCAQQGCGAPADGGKCQECGKAFCPEHVGAHEFTGYRLIEGRHTSWTRFVCAGCIGYTNRILLVSSARVARGQARQDERGYWWDAR